MSDPCLPPGVGSDGRPIRYLYGRGMDFGERQVRCSGCGGIFFEHQVEEFVCGKIYCRDYCEPLTDADGYFHRPKED